MGAFEIGAQLRLAQSLKSARQSFVYKTCRRGVSDYSPDSYRGRAAIAEKLLRSSPLSVYHTARLGLTALVLKQAPKKAEKLLIPLGPVVAAFDNVKLISEMSILENRRKIAVRRQEAFAFTTG